MWIETNNIPKKIILCDDTLDIIWKSYYSQNVIPIISSREESLLYLEDSLYSNNNLLSNNLLFFATNYNILRIMSGMPGIAYSY